MVSHPLYAQDKVVIDRLLQAPTPEPEHLIDAARLLMRYQGYPGCPDLKRGLHAALQRWGLGREELHARTRQIWVSGWRPVVLDETTTSSVGSGADVSAEGA